MPGDLKWSRHNNWCFWNAVSEKTLESSLDYKEIQPLHPKEDQSWAFIDRTDAEAETPILWPPDVKGWLIWKDPNAGRDWGQEEKGTTEDEMAGRHHRLDGHEYEWTPGVGDGQGGVACCDSWGRKESDTTERLSDWTELNWTEHKTGFIYSLETLFPFSLTLDFVEVYLNLDKRFVLRTLILKDFKVAPFKAMNAHIKLSSCIYLFWRSRFFPSRFAQRNLTIIWLANAYSL